MSSRAPIPKQGKASGPEKKGLPFPFGSSLFRAVNVKGSLVLLMLVAAGAWYLQHREESLLHTTQSIQVERIIDGDTFVGSIAPSTKAVLVGQQFRFRLRMVDAPEMSQPHGREATQALSRLLLSAAYDREVVCRIWEKDSWGRFIVDVFTRDNIRSDVLHVQRELVAGGHAWVFGGFTRDRGLAAVEEDAKKAKAGLWSAEKPVPPWIHRRMEREGVGSARSDGHHDDKRRSSRRDAVPNRREAAGGQKRERRTKLKAEHL